MALSNFTETVWSQSEDLFPKQQKKH
jgi:hypothetical protein